MIITNEQVRTATPAQVNTTTTWEELQKEEQELEDEITRNWLNGDEGNEDDTLFTDIDQAYLITLHDRIRYHTACALSSFTHKVLQENPDAPYLTQAPSDDPVFMEFIDAMEDTIRLECALGIMDPWDDQINPWQ